MKRGNKAGVVHHGREKGTLALTSVDGAEPRLNRAQGHRVAGPGERAEGRSRAGQGGGGRDQGKGG